jgi:uncharacterized protein involved in outer membrane biogenesis
MKLLGKLVLLVVVALVVLVLARNVVVKAVAENGVKAVTGMPLNMGKLDLGLSNTLVDIENLVVKNPSGFHDTSLVDIPKILVDYNLSSILKGKVHLENLEFDMKHFTVVRNEKGELNLDRLKALQGAQKPSAPTTKPEPQAPAKPMPIQIDMMHLKIGKVVYIDYSGGQPFTKEFRINLDQSYQNITDLNSVVRLIVLKAMMSSGISNLVNFDLGGLEGTLTGAFNTSTKLAAQAAAKSLDALQNAAKDPSQIAGQAGDLLKGTTSVVGDTAKGLTETASSLKDKFNPFKKSES